jgi:hypothetical protein
LDDFSRLAAAGATPAPSALLLMLTELAGLGLFEPCRRMRRSGVGLRPPVFRTEGLSSTRCLSRLPGFGCGACTLACSALWKRRNLELLRAPASCNGFWFLLHACERAGVPRHLDQKQRELRESFLVPRSIGNPAGYRVRRERNRHQQIGIFVSNGNM